MLVKRVDEFQDPEEAGVVIIASVGPSLPSVFASTIQQIYIRDCYVCGMLASGM